MAVTISFEWVLTDEEAALLDDLLASTRPVGAPPSWAPESREAYAEREGLKAMRSQIEHKRQEYRRKNLDAVSAFYDSLPSALQVSQLDQFGLELVGLDIRQMYADVPGLVGLTETEARESIATTKLRVGTVTYSSDEEVPADTVKTQSIPSGTSVPTRVTPIDLEVSTGPQVP